MGKIEKWIKRMPKIEGVTKRQLQDLADRYEKEYQERKGWYSNMESKKKKTNTQGIMYDLVYKYLSYVY